MTSSPQTSLPVIIEFAAPSSLVRERERASQLPVLGNGWPGTFVVFPRGLRISLPTDQIVAADDREGRAVVRFGGMVFTGLEEERLVFARVRELHPVERLSPTRSHRMVLEPSWVHVVHAAGRVVWPPRRGDRVDPVSESRASAAETAGVPPSVPVRGEA